MRRNRKPVSMIVDRVTKARKLKEAEEEFMAEQSANDPRKETFVHNKSFVSVN